MLSVAALGSVLAALLVFGSGFALGRVSDGDPGPVAEAPVIEAPVTEAPVTEALGAEASGAAPPTPAPEPTPEPQPTREPEPTAAPEATPTSAPRVQAADEAPIRTAVLSGGVVHLRGSVPDASVADEISGKVAQIVGPDNVVVEYEVDPDAPLPASAPLLVEDRVLFDSGQAEIRREFVPLLDLGVDLLERFPEATLTVVGHTDPRGSAAMNLALSQARVDAVTRYLVAQGIDPSRLLGQARGEGDLLTDDDSARGLAANRRAEFIVHGLLDT